MLALPARSPVQASARLRRSGPHPVPVVVRCADDTSRPRALYRLTQSHSCCKSIRASLALSVRLRVLSFTRERPRSARRMLSDTAGRATRRSVSCQAVWLCGCRIMRSGSWFGSLKHDGASRVAAENVDRDLTAKSGTSRRCDSGLNALSGRNAERARDHSQNGLSRQSPDDRRQIKEVLPVSLCRCANGVVLAYNGRPARFGGGRAQCSSLSGSGTSRSSRRPT